MEKTSDSLVCFLHTDENEKENQGLLGWAGRLSEGLRVSVKVTDNRRPGTTRRAFRIHGPRADFSPARDLNPQPPAAE